MLWGLNLAERLPCFREEIWTTLEPWFGSRPSPELRTLSVPLFIGMLILSCFFSCCLCLRFWLSNWRALGTKKTVNLGCQKNISFSGSWFMRFVVKRLLPGLGSRGAKLSGFPSSFALRKSFGSQGAKPTASENVSDFPRPSRFPSGFALGKSLGFREIGRRGWLSQYLPCLDEARIQS